MISVPRLLLLLSFGLMELHKLFNSFNEKVSLYINYSEENKQTLSWYVYDNCQMLTWVLVLTAILLAKKKNDVKKIVLIHIGYRVFDMAMYWWDFRQSSAMYIIAYTIITLIIIFDIGKWKWEH
jgi:hypothetical protein